MGHERDAARLVRELPEERHHPGLEPRIHPGGGLVQEEQAGTPQQLTRDAGAAPLAAGERVHPRAGVLVERQLVEDALDGGIDLLGGGVLGQPQARGEAERLPHLEQPVDDVLLRHVADVGEAVGERLAVDFDGTRRRRVHAGQHLQERGLAGAALADDRHQLPRLERRRGRREDLLLPGAHGHPARLEPKRADLAARDQAVAVEDQPVGPDADDGAVRELGALDQVAVDPGAVARVEVDDLHLPVADQQLGVEARHVRVGQDQVVRGVAADGEPHALEPDRSGLLDGGLARGHAGLLPREEAKPLVADLDDVAAREAARRRPQRAAVHGRAVARAQVVDPELAVPCLDAGMAAGHALARHDQVVRLGPADCHALRPDRDPPASVKQRGEGALDLHMTDAIPGRCEGQGL